VARSSNVRPIRYLAGRFLTMWLFIGLLFLGSACAIQIGVPLSHGYVTLEGDRLVLHTVCDRPLREASTNLVDDRGFDGPGKWEIRATGQPSTSIVLNVPNSGYETLMAWDEPVPDRFGVGFAVGSNPSFPAFFLTRSTMTADVVATEGGTEDKVTYLKREKQRLGCP
jgi:hypothetical protein